jgi:hypothetical protein
MTHDMNQNNFNFIFKMGAGGSSFYKKKESRTANTDKINK